MNDPEYCCFLHPLRKSREHPNFCPECGKAYTFPLEDMPNSIDKKLKFVKSIDRGFYGATYIVENPVRKFTIKLIPKETYKIYNKNFDKEIDNYKSAAKLDINIPDLIDAGEVGVVFKDTSIDCYFIQMQYIDGYSLKDFKISNELNANRIAQVAYDLFDFLRKLETADLHHNDLHDGNIIIQISSGEIGRLEAIDRTVKAYIIDLGSADDKDRSGRQHSRDVTWIVRHFKEMLDIYWTQASQDEQRVLSRLNRLVATLSGKEQVREINYEEYCNRIKSDVQRGENPWSFPKKLTTPGDYYNAQLMPSYYSSHLFFDPDDKWTKNLIKPGPILLTGMRGCGKTILLKSLHFLARAHKEPNEPIAQIMERLEKERHVGLFVSASTLLTDPKSKELHLPNHKLLLAFSGDLIKIIRYCELESIGKINYEQIERLCTNLEDLIPWFKISSSKFNIPKIQVRIEEALLKSRTITKENAGELNVHDAFDILASRVQGCNDIWINKHVIYLLDDLSVRYLTQDNIDELLSQLCHQAERFSFNISTETPTLTLRTGAGKVSRLDRDYEEFDLGNEVMHQLKRSGTSFLENVLKKRLELTEQYKGLSPTELLGTQSYTEIAKNLAGSNRGKKRGSYWGIDALGALSTGDIGDSILMFNKMLEKMDLAEGKISKDIQDSVIFNYSERKLRKLAVDDKWLYDHAVSFAQASQLELTVSYKKMISNNGTKLRQYNEVFLRIDPNEADNIFKRISNLVEGGIYIFAGGTPRSRTPGMKASLFLKLAFRKILGVTNLMPISFRDRFELSGKNLEDWLEKPTASKLRKTVGSDSYCNLTGELPEWDWSDFEDHDSRITLKPGEKSQFIQESLEKYIIDNKDFDNVYGIPYTVESCPLRELKHSDLTGKHIIGAIGFEERSIGTWKNILVTGKPDKVTLIDYRNESNKERIIEILNEANVTFSIVPYEQIISRGLQDIDRGLIAKFVKSIFFDDIILDVTSLNKPLIFLLTSEILKQKKELGIIHTDAEIYLPNADEISGVMSLLNDDARQFFEEADRLVKGELDPQSKMVIWQNRNPSSEIYLICLISLKYLRAKKLIEELPVSFRNIIYPISPEGENSAKSRFAKEIALSFVSESGSIWPANSHDHEQTFKVLTDLFIKYSLEYGLNFELGLTGVKMHTVAAAMLASIANLSGIYYTPVIFEPSKYTKGTGKTTYTDLKIRSIQE